MAKPKRRRASAAALPPNPFSELDPQDEKSRAQVTLAHALLLQGRDRRSARDHGRPSSPRYRAELKGGAGGLAFTKDFSYALYVDALARPVSDPTRRGPGGALRTGRMGDEVNWLVDYPDCEAESGRVDDPRTASAGSRQAAIALAPRDPPAPARRSPSLFGPCRGAGTRSARARSNSGRARP